MALGVIPARFKSSRFPGKVLADILGKSLVQRTYERAVQSKMLTELVVATDHEEVFDHVMRFGGRALMTPPECESGSHRTAHVVAEHFPDVEHVVNIQVDEPLLNPKLIDRLVSDHLALSHAPLMTLVAKISDPSLITSPSTVKCVFDRNGRALYFSRSPIPYSQRGGGSYFRHMGIYSFQRSFLLKYAQLSSTALRETEDLEQLKVLEHGYDIYVALVEDETSVEVNEPADLVKVEKILESVSCRESISL